MRSACAPGPPTPPVGLGPPAGGVVRTPEIGSDVCHCLTLRRGVEQSGSSFGLITEGRGFESRPRYRKSPAWEELCLTEPSQNHNAVLGATMG